MHVADTVRGFREILEGKHDHIGERHFMNAGSIEDAIASHAKAQQEL